MANYHHYVFIGGQVSFPPALLAANPGLANASPGSLVVVASPASPQITSPNAQLLQVFMVGPDQGTVHVLILLTNRVSQQGFAIVS